jgi:deoxyribodipyrimidine photolyase
VKPAAIRWFTSDLRLDDNPALAEAGRALAAFEDARARAAR